MADVRITHSHRIAIRTWYLGPTDHKPARVVAEVDGSAAREGRRVVVPYHSASDTDPHDRAALALCEKFGWRGTLRRGGDCYVWED